MSISELIQHVGDEHIAVQYVDQNLVSVSATLKVGKITISTRPDIAHSLAFGGSRSHIGLVLWIPVERMPKIEAVEQGEEGAR